jgi:AsmA protein
MKKVLIIVLVLVVVLIGGLVLAPFLIPVDTLKQQLQAQVERATGRALRIEGPVDLQILPTLAVEAEDVRFANAEGAANPDMATLKALQAELRLWPLLSGSIEVDRFVLIQPVVHLEVDQEGRPNWSFAEATEPDAAEGQPAGEAEGGGARLPVSDLALGDIRLEDGTITYSDARSGAAYQVEDIDVSVDLQTLRSPLRATGSLDYKGKEVTLDVGLQTPLALIQNGASEASVQLRSELVSLAFDGQVSNDQAPGVQGGADLSVSSIRELAAWLAQPLELPGEGLQTLEIAGRLQASPQRVAFEQAEIRLDQIEAQGEVLAELGGEVPCITGRLDTGLIDLNPYLPPQPEVAGEPGPEGTPPAPAGEAGWSDEPLAIPPIGGADVDFQLTTDGVRYREIKLGPTALGLSLKGNTLTADLEDAVLYDGRGKGQLSVSVTDGMAAIRQQFTLNGLQALPLLTDAAGFERLEGTTDAQFDLQTRGRSQLELVSNLSGSGHTAFTDGAIVGVNLAAMVRDFRSAFLDPGAGEARKTDFAELSGSFVVENGLLRNDDLKLQAPLLRLAGKGQIDLPARALDYRIEPLAAPTLEGQGGEEQVAGILVPVTIEGPWSDPQIRPDLSGLVETAISNPEQLKEQLDQLQQQGGSLGEAAEKLKQSLEGPQGGDAQEVLKGLSGVLGGQQQQEGDAQPPDQQQQGGEQAPQDPAQRLLKGLFGN